MGQKIRVAAVSDVPVGGGIETVVGARVVALFNVDGEFRAIDGICAHAGGPLGKGSLSGSIVTCPWHGWQYDVNSGQHCLTAAICQQSFAVSVENDDVFVEIPEA